MGQNCTLKNDIYPIRIYAGALIPILAGCVACRTLMVLPQRLSTVLDKTLRKRHQHKTAVHSTPETTFPRELRITK